MIPRISKRYATTPKPRKERKGHLYCLSSEHEPVERMTLTRYITRPLDRPSPTKHALGRTDSIAHLVGVSRESALPHVLPRSSSPHSLGREIVGNARGPCVGPPNPNSVIWWNPGEDPKAFISAISHDSDVRQNRLPFSRQYQESRVTISKGTLSFPKLAITGQQARPFHSSARRTFPSGDSYHADHIVPNFYVKHKKERKKHAEDLMTSPSTPSTTSPSSTDASGLGLDAAEQAAHDPARQTRAAKRRKQEQSSLMHHLSDSILGDDLVASTRRLVSKIPVEHYDKDGNLVHPSGFVVPGKGHSSSSNPARAKERARDEDEDRATQTAAVAERILESDLDHVHSAMASTRPRSHKVPFEIREPDGTVKHPSGFVPPTPANMFKYSDSASLERGLSGAISRQRARDVENKNIKFVKGRGLHTSAVVRATE